MKTLLTVIFCVFTTVFVSAEEPEQLITLRDSWNRARERALKPIDQKYLSSLQEMKLRFTKAGNLEAAIAIDAEIKKLSSKEASQSKLAIASNDSLESVLDGTVWRRMSGHRYDISFTKTHVRHSNSEFEAEYIVDGDTVRYKGALGDINIKISRNRKSAEFSNSQGATELERIK